MSSGSEFHVGELEAVDVRVKCVPLDAVRLGGKVGRISVETVEVGLEARVVPPGSLPATGAVFIRTPVVVPIPGGELLTSVVTHAVP